MRRRSYDVLPRRAVRLRRLTWPVMMAIGLVVVPFAGANMADRAAAATSAGVPSGTVLKASGSITITKPGTVIDARNVTGSIAVKANNVTIKRTKVTYGGYHSIRIYSGVTGTVVEDSTIVCTDSSKTNGVVFGNYTARRLAVSGCRNAFLFSATAPAVITDSLVNGLPYTNVTATASSTPTTSSSTSSSSTSSSFPDASTTGVPAGTILTPSGGITVTTNGAIIDSKLISGGVVVKANNVTIRNSLIRTSSHNAIQLASGYAGLVVYDTEIDGMGVSGPAVVGSGYTLRRVNLHNVVEGPRLGSNTTVDRSYIHHLVRCSSCHVDALQTTGGSNIVISNNNLQAYNPDTNDPMNAAFQFGEEFSPVRNAVVSGNLMNGGNYTVNGGGGGTTGAEVTFRNNRFQRDFRYGPAGNLFAGVSFDSSNVWDDNGTPIR